ncbi:hypothetical protein AVEN_139507-1 [Araneus ventricosus]|uniref:Genetic suppressor element-like domain-containing protein n=1 Tax=Araneus ventricosus TaxID=182803 RepID=A0A4Y2IE79_ARAVE|nr:hypothetical protein AVEN_139507-1 [Araneus ventricosus]
MLHEPHLLSGLPHGCKPPSLSMQHPCNPPQKHRTMAAVSPLHQVVPAQPNIPSYEGANLAFNTANRTSSFAAALRKLAKQAVDPVSGEKDLTQISPVSSPVLSQGSLTPKRSVSNAQPPPQAMFLTNHQVSYAASSPPVMTIAPSRPVATHTSESRKVMDLSNVQQVNNSSTLSNGHLQDSLGVKIDSSKGVPRPAHSEKWDESNMPNKGLSGSTSSSQSRPHATIAPLPRPDDSLTSSRGFQPYRGTEESRNTLPHHLSLFDHPHPAASYPYTPAFLPPPHLSHPAYRFDDPLYLERYSLLRPPVMPYPQPSMMAPPAAFYPNSRYAADLLAQSLSISSTNSNILNHERLKQEEERRMREKEIELDQSRTKEQERQREKEHKEKETREREHKEREQREKEKKEREKSHREREEHKKSHNSNYSSSSSKRTESPSVRNAPVIQCTPTTIGNHASAPTTVNNPIPLNLVIQPSPEPLKKEAELWTPWQQPVTNYPKENGSQEFGKPVSFRSQEIHRSHATKDGHVNDKANMRFSPSTTNEKKQSSIPTIESSGADSKKHSTSDTKRFDTIHHHIAELSNKDHAPHEWRHEKLQKACTNNHRKSHESKKSKEDRNNIFQNHQRKAVNGAILKSSPYQNEGMHARLLESEKCRLEMNGHALPKTHTANNINDRLVVPSFKSSHQSATGKEIVPQKLYTDFYSAPLLKSNIDFTTVVSKLDLDAKNLKKDDFKCHDDDAKEELRLKNFLIITKVPPQKFESSPQKLKFLQLLGLTTHFKRKKIEFDMYLKRRKILREDSAIPPLSLEPETEDTSLLPSVGENNAYSDRLAEQLRAKTNPIKLEFLFKIGLTPITLVKKEEKERIRRIVDEEKIRRHYRMLAKVNRKSSPRRLFVPKSETAQKLDHLRKLKEMNSVSNGLTSKHLHGEAEDMMDVKYTPSNSLLTPKVEQVPYHCSSESNESLNSSSVSTSSERIDSSYSSPHNKSFNKFSFKRGHSLKNEFRFLAPESSHRSNHVTRTSDLPAGATAENCSVGIQVEPNFFTNPVDKTLADLKNSFNWPGLEAIMEAFYRHQNEQSSEKVVLIERCHQLRQTQEELKMEADGLSRQMSDLLRCKRELDEERQKHQHAIDHLKQCLQIGR